MIENASVPPLCVLKKQTIHVRFTPVPSLLQKNSTYYEACYVKNEIKTHTVACLAFLPASGDSFTVTPTTVVGS